MGRRIYEIKGMRYVGSTSTDTYEEILRQINLDYFKNYDYILEGEHGPCRALFYEKDPNFLKETKDRITQIFR